MKISSFNLFIRLNIGNRNGSAPTPTISEEPPAAVVSPMPRLRLKRPRLEIDDDDVVITNGNGH